MSVLDLQRPYKKLDNRPGGADWIEQDGDIFCWSDSNVQYEKAWWLDDRIEETHLIKHLRETRVPGKPLP